MSVDKRQKFDAESPEVPKFDAPPTIRELATLALWVLWVYGASWVTVRKWRRG